MQPRTESSSTHSSPQAWAQKHKTIVWQHVKTMQLHTESMSTQFRSGMSTETRPNCATCQNNATAYRKYEHTHTVSLRHRHTDTDILCFKFSFLWIPPHLDFYQTIWLVMHVNFLALTQLRMQWHAHSSRCLVKAEENSFKYKQHALLEASY